MAKSLRPIQKYLISAGVILYILTPILFLFATRTVANWFPCTNFYYGSEILSCNPPVIRTGFAMVVVPLFVGSILILIALVRRK
jgi:hypothetical protein